VHDPRRQEHEAERVAHQHDLEDRVCAGQVAHENEGDSERERSREHPRDTGERRVGCGHFRPEAIETVFSVLPTGFFIWLPT
jgi:hypothetical protein